MIFAFVVSWSCAYGQERLTKKRVLKAFNESIESSLSDEWISCNEDSAFYRSKLVKLYNHINYLYDPNHCCNHIQWKFTSHKVFNLSTVFICNEPPTATVWNKLSRHEVVVSEIKNQVFLTTANAAKKTQYKVLALDNITLWNGKNECLVLTLERVLILVK